MEDEKRLIRVADVSKTLDAAYIRVSDSPSSIFASGDVLAIISGLKEDLSTDGQDINFIEPSEEEGPTITRELQFLFRMREAVMKRIREIFDDGELDFFIKTGNEVDIKEESINSSMERVSDFFNSLITNLEIHCFDYKLNPEDWKPEENKPPASPHQQRTYLPGPKKRRRYSDHPDNVQD